MKRTMTMTTLLALALALLAPANTGAQAPPPLEADAPEAFVFYTPPELTRLMGWAQAQPTSLALCNIGPAKQRILAAAEWRSRSMLDADQPIRYELSLEPGKCGVRQLEEHELPDQRGIRTTWRFYVEQPGPEWELRRPR